MHWSHFFGLYLVLSVDPSGHAPILEISNRNNSAEDCSIMLKFGTEFVRVPADKIQMFEVKRSKINFKVSSLRRQQ